MSLASKGLGLTQPAASQQLRELERILAIRLLDRAAGRFILTPAGHSLLAPARRALAAADDAVSSMSEYRSGEVGQLRLGTGATACIHILPPVLAGVKRAMPGLSLSVAIGNTTELLPRVEDCGLDLALVAMPSGIGRTLSSTRLFLDPLVAILPEASAHAEAVITAEQLSTLPLILYEAGGQTRAITDDWFEKAGISPKPIMELGSVEAIKVLVAAGLGAAVLPKSAVPTTSLGVVIRELYPAAVRELAFVMRKEKVVDRGLRLFLAELRKITSLKE